MAFSGFFSFEMDNFVAVPATNECTSGWLSAWCLKRFNSLSMRISYKMQLQKKVRIPLSQFQDALRRVSTCLWIDKLTASVDWDRESKLGCAESCTLFDFGMLCAAAIADRLAVQLGCELLKMVPGRVSTEVDAHLSYDTDASVEKALKLVDLYEQKGIGPERLYIKMASTWEGIRACEILQKKGIDCNMTLLFSFAQVQHRINNDLILNCVISCMILLGHQLLQYQRSLPQNTKKTILIVSTFLLCAPGCWVCKCKR